MNENAAPIRPLRAFLGALAWLAAVVAPVALYQAWAVIESLIAALVSLTVLLGGRSVIAIFEATVHAVMGDRPDTMMSGAPWFYALTIAQTLLLAAAIAWRRRRAGRFLEPWTLLLLCLVGVNAALAADWPWWGT